MSILIKLRLDIKEGSEEDFRENQRKLCAVIQDDHPGVICYHVDYPEPGVSEWVEIYANNEVFRAHLANERGAEPLQNLIAACDKITCRCWGDPDEASKEILAGFGATYHATSASAFALHPRADRNSLV